MQIRSTVSLTEGHENLKKLIAELGPDFLGFNEATTRLYIIDRLLTDCLGWPKNPEQLKIEDHHDGQFADYIMGSPECVVWEAKKAGVYFDFPADGEKKPVQSLQDIIAVSKSAEAAIRQVQGYCSDRGIEFAVACNGYQIIAFVAVKIGQVWLKGKALTIRSLAQLDAEFATFWQCLSPDGISEKRLMSLLEVGTTRAIPKKLSTLLFRFPSIRYKSDLQTNLRTLGELLIEDVATTDALKAKFYSDCYCDTGALSRDSLVSEKILRARYAALFPASEDSPQLEPAAQAGSNPTLSNQILTEALARRPIVLLGDVGVGKTSFLEDLMLVRAPKEFERAIAIYIDLGSRAALETDIRKFIIAEIERQLQEKYNVDVNEQNFVRGVYDLEVKRFRSSFKASIYKSNKTKYDQQVASQIAELLEEKSEHLRRSIEHVSRARLRQIIFIIDNADQRQFEVQQSAFIIAQEFAKNWNALTFIAVRPQTFFQSKRSGALSAYPHKVFTILPPRPELVIEKRLVFALKIAEGKVSASILQGVKLQIGSVALFLQALLYSLKYNRDLPEILSNITGGNIRAVIEFITRFIGSPNVDAEKSCVFNKRRTT